MIKVYYHDLLSAMQNGDMDDDWYAYLKWLIDQQSKELEKYKNQNQSL